MISVSVYSSMLGKRAAYCKVPHTYVQRAFSPSARILGLVFFLLVKERAVVDLETTGGGGEGRRFAGIFFYYGPDTAEALQNRRARTEKV